MDKLTPPPEPGTFPVITCPSCGHGIDSHGTDPGGPCGVGDAHGNLCQCFWPPNDIAADMVRGALDADAQIADRMRIVGEFLMELREFGAAITDCPDTTPDYHRWQGHAEARRTLADRLNVDLVALGAIGTCSCGCDADRRRTACGSNLGGGE